MNEDDDGELPPGSAPPHPGQSTAARPAGWPKGVRPISIDAFNHMGVGNDGRLYWNGKSVEVARSVTLTTWQRAAAALTVIAALAAAGGSVASAIADWRTPACLSAPMTR